MAAAHPFKFKISVASFPHRFGEWLVFKADGRAACEDKVYCKRFDNWHWWPSHQRCYRQFSQGPCRKGQLFYLDPDSGKTGCDCRPEWEAYYYAINDKCYEQESKGPCPVGQYFAYNATSRTTECSCFKNFVFNPVQVCITTTTFLKFFKTLKKFKTFKTLKP